MFSRTPLRAPLRRWSGLRRPAQAPVVAGAFRRGAGAEPGCWRAGSAATDPALGWCCAASSCRTLASSSSIRWTRACSVCWSGVAGCPDCARTSFGLASMTSERSNNCLPNRPQKRVWLASMGNKKKNFIVVSFNQLAASLVARSDRHRDIERGLGTLKRNSVRRCLIPRQPSLARRFLLKTHQPYRQAGWCRGRRKMSLTYLIFGRLSTVPSHPARFVADEGDKNPCEYGTG